LWLCSHANSKGKNIEFTKVSFDARDFGGFAHQEQLAQHVAPPTGIVTSNSIATKVV